MAPVLVCFLEARWLPNVPEDRKKKKKKKTLMALAPSLKTCSLVAHGILFYFMYDGTCYTMTPMLRVCK
jgi:hypothetical protein